MEVTDLSTLLSTFPGSVSQERKGVRNPDTVVQGKKEELREFKLSRKLLEELPDAVEEEQKHWCLRRGKLRGWNCGDLKGEEDSMMGGDRDTEQATKEIQRWKSGLSIGGGVVPRAPSSAEPRDPLDLIHLQWIILYNFLIPL